LDAVLLNSVTLSMINHSQIELTTEYKKEYMPVNKKFIYNWIINCSLKVR